MHNFNWQLMFALEKQDRILEIDILHLHKIPEKYIKEQLKKIRANTIDIDVLDITEVMISLLLLFFFSAT